VVRSPTATFGWNHSVDLQPHAPDEFEVPVGGETMITLELTADSAFVPNDLDNTSTDTRALGVWVEVVQ
jgi:hypothetical protein